MCARSGRFHMGLSSALRHMLANWRASREKENDKKKNLKKEKNTELAFKGPREKNTMWDETRVLNYHRISFALVNLHLLLCLWICYRDFASALMISHLLSSLCICSCDFTSAPATLHLLESASARAIRVCSQDLISALITPASALDNLHLLSVVCICSR